MFFLNKNSGVSIILALSGLVFLITLSPAVFAQVPKLTAADGGASYEFGTSVSISGDTAIVGAPFAKISTSTRGAAYIFQRNQGGAGNWGQVKKLIAADNEVGDEFGISVAISGDWAVVGSHFSDTGNGNDRGAAYVFARNQGGANNWGQVVKLSADDGLFRDFFGRTVAISGDWIVVGAEEDDNLGAQSGSAYVFNRNQGGAGNWGQVTRLNAGDGLANDLFGSSVAISGDWIVVGAEEDDGAESNSGSAYVFNRNQGGADNWGQVRKLTDAGGALNDFFGNSVGISGDWIVVGARSDDDQANGAGSAFVFGRNLGGVNNWGLATQLTSDDAALGDDFGFSVAISGDRIVVGARFDDDSGQESGSAYVFVRNQGGADNWGQAGKLTAGDGVAEDWFGFSAAVSDDLAVVGALQDDDQGQDSGSAYVFQLPDTDPNVIFSDGFES